MKKIMILLLVSILISCTQTKPVVENMPVHIDSTSYYKAKCDTLAYMVVAYETAIVNYENNETGLGKVIAELNDSIQKLNYRPLMTKAQFMDLYRYDRVKKYYRICVNKPTQWKFIKSWLARAIEDK
ncbi:MAG TPA: hypothetical protein VIK29_07035 [Paludibacter sp.]